MGALRERVIRWVCVAAVCAGAVWLSAFQSQRHLALASAGQRADALVNEGRLTEAEATLRRALEADPDSFDLRDRLADLLLSSGRQQEALAQRRRALQCNPRTPRAYRALADTCDVLRRHSEATRAMEQYLALWPEDPHALHVLAYCYERSGQPERALAAWKRLLRLVPGHLSARRGIARLGGAAASGEDHTEKGSQPNQAPRQTETPDLGDPNGWM